MHVNSSKFVLILSMLAYLEKSRFVNEWMKSLIRVRLLVRNAYDGKPQCCIRSSASCVSWKFLRLGRQQCIADEILMMRLLIESICDCAKGGSDYISLHFNSNVSTGFPRCC